MVEYIKPEGTFFYRRLNMKEIAKANIILKRPALAAVLS
jgi:hypothetical protein